MHTPARTHLAVPVARSRTIEAVVFDVGETLLDETFEYHAWADWLGVPRHTFSSVFGAVVGAGRDHREAFEYFREGFDLDAERGRRAAAGRPESYGEHDLYPDARPTLAALREAGYLVIIAANQTGRSHRILDSLHLPVDLVTTSDTWGVAKPDPRFFRKVIEVCQDLRPTATAGRICYVGDRLDNDLRPAWDAGLRTAHIRRGPWGHMAAYDSDLIAKADFRLTTLADLPALLAEV
ncbi:MAG TPA: HAD family hydrolase [Actinocrinis sp.]|uniref:HAD family hydrolase n=1 Tax=Actinocrinis sp. TaxID=1920516 RepID=UPI002DDDA731|nr:HAD family hydrolase [Actinocrinis sp.]HEV2344178.1 HAD family hydrolase [Actinocrinis sp.]